MRIAATQLTAPSRRHVVPALVGLALITALALLPTTARSLPAAVVTIRVFENDSETGQITGTPVPNFQWQINLDNSHDNSSLNNKQSYSPVLASGQVTNDSGMFTVSLPPLADPLDRGYLVTVFANDGVGDQYPVDYKLGGAPFGPGDTYVVVGLYPHPLPLSTLRVRVFRDNRDLNTYPDDPFEEGLGGFHVTLADRVGEVTTDWFGNSICTKYEDVTPDGVFDPDDYVDGAPVPVPGTGGFCATSSSGADADLDGYTDGCTVTDFNHCAPKGWVVIPNMGPDKYEVQAIPPDGEGWIQTSTIEGTKIIDGWVEEGADGFSTEAGFQLPLVWVGFVQQCTFGDAGDSCVGETADATGKDGVIKGLVKTNVIDNDAGALVPGVPVVRPWIALTDLSGNDHQVYTSRGNADGSFTISNVPEGLYQLVVWDEPLDYIIQFVTVEVTKDNCGANLKPCTVDLGDVLIPRWFSWLKGTVYIDANENGIRDPGEVGLPNQDLDTRFKDGTIQYAAFSDAQGNYEFPEIFELEHFTIPEVGYSNTKQTGAAAYMTDDLGMPVGYPNNPINQDLGLASLLQAGISWGGTTNYIDWGKKAFSPGENGGIVGIVFNATTRNELDARLQANEDYEPGVPGAVVNLYAPQLEGGAPVLADDGSVAKDHIVATYGGADSWYDSRPENCLPQGSIGRDPTQVQPYPDIWDKCLELPSILNQVKSGVFDGGYAFEEDCSSAVEGNLDPDLLSEDCSPLGAGQYIVEVVPPAGYRPVMEEDINVFGGDQLVPAVPPFPCAGPTHVVDVVDDPSDADFDPTDPHNTKGVYNPDFLATTSALAPDGGSPFEGEEKPLCDSRLVDLPTGGFVNSDFFLFTDAVSKDPESGERIGGEFPAGFGIPQPGRVVGLLVDDLTLQLDPNSALYAEKRGIPNTPVGVRDFKGNLITTVMSDANGYWEVLLPSTGTYNCALPAGPCPGTYQFVGNDPGDPANPNPNWNPNYGSLRLVFDVWPGTTTYADVAVLPIAAFQVKGLTQFETPPACEIPDGAPDLQQVDDVVVDSVSGGSITLMGSSLGGATLDGMPLATSGNGTSRTATIPAGTAPGTHQLLATGGGQTSQNGITIHVTGAGYSPTVVDVMPGDSIQDALDTASAGSLILVHPGVYYDSIVMSKEVKLQGFGPGATVVDGRFFNFGGITPAQFQDRIDAAAPYGGPATVPMGQVITVLAADGEFGPAGGDTFNAQIDGFAIRSGNRVRGNAVTASQGGGIYAHAYARNLELSNNLIQSNAGVQGGGVILGRSQVGNSENDGVRLHHNRVLNNGGKILAGGIALFTGSDDYRIDHNVICGNYSAEYGGGISHWGKSAGGRIQDNQVLFNFAFDEGGGIMIAGEPVKAGVSDGSGAVTIERNRAQGNVSNDDGGGIRLLSPVEGRVRIVNNMIVNNLATDTGGGLALDDALNVQIVNNTVARNISTATAEDADRSTCSPPLNGTCPHGAGLTSERHSEALRNEAIDPTVKPGYCTGTVNCTDDFSNPVLFNNIVWDNKAYFLDGNLDLYGTMGLPLAGVIDFDVIGSAGHYHATYSRCTAASDHCSSAAGDHNIISALDPGFLEDATTTFAVLAFAADPSFVTVLIESMPDDPQGDYHVGGGSSVVDAGTSAVGSVAAPCDDFDGDFRPNGAGFDIGADEQPGGAGVCGGGGGGPTLHVGDLDNTSNNPPSSNWNARVRILVHDGSHALVGDAVVSGSWSNGATGTGMCTTGTSGGGLGWCEITRGGVPDGTASVTFTVTNVTKAGSTYQPADNHDPDGEPPTPGTVITVAKP